MRRFLPLGAICAIIAAAVAAPAMTTGIGPPGSTIYAFDVAYRTIATSLPNRGPLLGDVSGGMTQIVRATATQSFG